MKARIDIAWTVDFTHLILRTPPGFKHANCGFDRDAARALIADQLAVFQYLWPDAPMPDAAHASLAPILAAQGKRS